MTLQLILAGLNVVLVWFSIYMYARTKGKQEQYEKARNSFLNSKIDTICDKLVELEKKYGKLLEERRCIQLYKDMMEMLKHIDLNTTAISIMVTESKIKECEEKEDFEKVKEFNDLLEADKNYLLKKMMQEASTNDNLARKFFDKIKEMAKKYDNAESND
ncbi:MAG: hypothetical protein ACFN4S_00165 [Prevotella conceptionensis]